MAKVSVVLCLCPVGSASSIVQARAVLVSTEVVDRENDHVCISRPSEGGITSVNVTFLNLMGRSAIVCMSDSLKTTSALGRTCNLALRVPKQIFEASIRSVVEEDTLS